MVSLTMSSLRASIQLLKSAGAIVTDVAERSRTLICDSTWVFTAKHGDESVSVCVLWAGQSAAQTHWQDGFVKSA